MARLCLVSNATGSYMFLQCGTPNSGDRPVVSDTEEASQPYHLSAANLHNVFSELSEFIAQQLCLNVRI